LLVDNAPLQHAQPDQVVVARGGGQAEHDDRLAHVGLRRVRVRARDRARARARARVKG
jgi:hypothetical protein